MAEPREDTHQHGGNANWRQFWLLLWKNWLLQKKKKRRTVAIVLLPIIFHMILVMLRNDMKYRPATKTTHEGFPVETTLRTFRKERPKKFILAYAPKTTLVEKILNRAATLMGVKITGDLGFADGTALENYVTTDGDIFGAIVFVKSDWVSLPKTLYYEIRLQSEEKSMWNPDEMSKVEWKTDSTFNDLNTPGPNYYQNPRNLTNR